MKSKRRQYFTRTYTGRGWTRVPRRYAVLRVRVRMRVYAAAHSRIAAYIDACTNAARMNTNDTCTHMIH